MSWIILAKRPLALEELQHALGIEDGDMQLNEDGIPTRDKIEAVCLGAIELQCNGTMHFAHYAVQEYFRSYLKYDDSLIASTCLTVLNFEEFEDGPRPKLAVIISSESSMSMCMDLGRRSHAKVRDARMAKYHLFQYAGMHWGEHARGEAESHILDQAINFCAQEKKLLASMQAMKPDQILSPSCLDKGIGPCCGLGYHALWIAAHFGLIELMHALLTTAKVNANGRCRAKRPPLTEAYLCGFPQVCDLLLENGADVNVRDFLWNTLATYAIERGDRDRLASCLQHNLLIDDHTGSPRLSYLGFAARHGSLDIFLMILHEMPSNLNQERSSALFEIVRLGKRKMFSALLMKQPDVNVTDESGYTPLHLAASGEILEQLVQHGALLEARSKKGETPLHTAAKRGDKSAMETLLYLGSEVDALDHSRRSTFAHACDGGSLAAVELLMEYQGAAMINHQSDDGATPLHIALRSSRWCIADFLLDLGADANIRDQKGCTPLFYARGKSLATILERSSKVNLVNDFGETPLHYLMDLGTPADVHMLMEKGANCCAVDQKGFTPLHPWSLTEVDEVRRDFAAKARAILVHDKRAINMKGDGKTPLHAATEYDLRDAVNLFLDFGADLSINSDDDTTILQDALDYWTKLQPNKLGDGANYDRVSQCDIEELQRLLKSGADHTVRDKRGLTPLASSLRYLHIDVAATILRRGTTSLEIPDDEGRTPLHYAAEFGSVDQVRMLLDFGANVLAEDERRLLPLDRVKRSSKVCKDILELLVLRTNEAKIFQHDQAAAWDDQAAAWGFEEDEEIAPRYESFTGFESRADIQTRIGARSSLLKTRIEKWKCLVRKGGNKAYRLAILLPSLQCIDL